MDETSLREALNNLGQANAQGWGAYFAVGFRHDGLGRSQRGGKADLAALPALFVDVDRHDRTTLNDLRSLIAPPSCIVDSGGGFHAYWWLDAPITDFDRAAALLQRLRPVCGADVVSIAHSMRLPGSINTKSGRGLRRCTILESHPRHYALDTLERSLPTEAIVTHQPAKPFSTLQTLHTLQRREPPSTTLNPDLIQVVADHLRQHYNGYLKPNGYLAACCPCGHHHDAPGQHFNFDIHRGIGHCFGKHGRLLLKDLCTQLRIDPQTYGGLYR